MLSSEYLRLHRLLMLHRCGMPAGNLSSDQIIGATWYAADAGNSKI